MADDEAVRDFPDDKQRAAFCHAQFRREDQADLFGPSSVLRYDRSELPEKAEVTPEGYLRADAVLTRTGVFQYQNPDGSIRRELRHPDDVFHPEALASFRMRPVTDMHPPTGHVDSATYRRLAIGFTGENVRQDGTLVRGPISITDAEGVETVKGGRRFLSCGYTARLEEGPGVYLGEPWDYRQRDIRGDHVAIVDSPRAGSVAQIRLDGHQEIEIPKNDPKGGTAMKTTVVLDGISYEAAPEVANALRKTEERLAEIEKRLDSQKADLDKVAGERDAIKAKLDQAESDMEEERKTLDARIRDMAAELNDLLSMAAEIAEKESEDEGDAPNLDAMTADELRAFIVSKVSPDVKLDGKSADYIAAAFDVAKATIATRRDERASRNDALARQRETVTTRKDQSAATDARQRLADRVANQWKPDWKASA